MQITVPKDLQAIASRSQLTQVLVNLLQNALDAMRELGGEVIRVDASVEGDEVLLRVADDGPGVPEPMLERLFEPFATSKPPGEGTGLGLYTSYMLVDAMGGRLSLENAEGGGAVALVRLPRVRTSLTSGELALPETGSPPEPDARVHLAVVGEAREEAR